MAGFLDQSSHGFNGSLSNGILVVCAYTQKVKVLPIGITMLMECLAVKRLVIGMITLDLDLELARCSNFLIPLRVSSMLRETW